MTPADVERGRRYLLQSCADGRRAGDVVEAVGATLHIDDGDGWRGATIVRVTLDVAACS
jgi:hypothetical protein